MRRSMKRSPALAILLALIGAAPAIAGADSGTAVPSARHALNLMGEGDWSGAKSLLLARCADERSRWPDHYNLACCHARLNERDEAFSALERAIARGFRKWDLLRDDADLTLLRGDARFEAILEAGESALRESGEALLRAWKEDFGEEGYRFAVDPEERLVFACAVDERAEGELRRMLFDQAKWCRQHLFPGRLPQYVLIVIPVAADADKILGKDERVGGRYDHRFRRLVSRSIGHTLRHEFLHVLHWAHMENSGASAPHAIWVQEGLASLFEDYRLHDEGEIEFLPNVRASVARGVVRDGDSMPSWTTFFALDHEAFMARAEEFYPIVRSIFEFIAADGRLESWYSAYMASADEDPSGLTAMRLAFERPAEEVEATWRTWLRDRRTVISGAAESILGIKTGRGAPDGVLVGRVTPGSPAASARILPGDVIVRIADGETRTNSELRRVLVGLRPGDAATVRVRRGDQFIDLKVRWPSTVRDRRRTSPPR